MNPENIRDFIDFWTDKGNEEQDTQKFWIDLFETVLGVEGAARLIDFEKTVEIGGRSKRIDAYIPGVKALVEQKSLGKPLTKKYRQSDGATLTPIEQARRYGRHLGYDEFPRWYVASNFSEIRIYDNNSLGAPPEIIYLKDLERDYTRLGFLLDKKDEHIEKEKELSIQAGELVGKIYDALLEEYNDPTDEKTLESLNVLVVRLVFLAWAEDTGVLSRHQFRDYMEQFRENPSAFRRELAYLFKVLDTPVSERKNLYLEDELAIFPYTNGGLFADKGIEIPRFNDKIIDLILDEACSGFNWGGISPTIFGAVFESSLNPQTRRSGGMHYTSIENIHKVIDPLFLDDLKRELHEIRQTENIRGSKTKALHRYIDKLAGLRFLDPACGAGNFLTETYRSLRELENKALSDIYDGQIRYADKIANPIKVNIGQFYGIEINDFAVAVANTALFISEYQMLKETEEILRTHFDYLPLRRFENIHEGNALRMDWEDVLTPDKCDYLISNPPFVGAMLMSGEQRQEIKAVMKGFKGVGELDYVCGWFKKAVDYMKESHMVASFVATNSIVQGQQAVLLWKPLFEKSQLKILFAYEPFVWDSQSTDKARVHCVIVGFSVNIDREPKIIYSQSGSVFADNINAYLKPGKNIFIESRSVPLCPVPPMRFGNMPRDGGGFCVSDEEKKKIEKKYPKSAVWVHPYIGAKEMIDRKDRWCLWLKNATPKEIKSCPLIRKKVEDVRNFRLASKAAATRRLAEKPALFAQIAQPEYSYIAVPRVSSERRRYIPIAFFEKNVIASDALLIIPDAELYHFGILTSNVHNAWMRAVAGRLEMRYRYSKDIVYNNFPWPEPTQKQKELIERTAQNILEVRERYPNCSLADLYDETLMPADLRKAHQANDRAVMKAYGFDWRNMTEEECVAELMKLYSEKVAELAGNK